MFGYIIVNKPEMKFKEFDEYRSYYCGLCHALKNTYGAKGQLTLSYDMTFLAILLTSLYEPETETSQARCILHPIEKHTYVKNRMIEYVADMNVLLSYLKCLDDWEDEKKLHRLLYAKLLEGKTKERKELYREKMRSIYLQMQKISEMEKENCQDVDAMATAFGHVMAEIVACKDDEWCDSLKALGFYLGQFIYLVDAYEDIEEDMKKKRYNPLSSRYHLPDFEEKCHSILTMVMANCCMEFEKLPILDNIDILRNILYSGVWCRYETVREKRVKEEKGHE